MNKGKSRFHGSRCFLAAAIAATTLVSACSSGGQTGAAGDQTGQKQEKSTPIEKLEPVVLNIYGGRYVSEEQFMESYGSYIQKKYPHISFNVYGNKNAADIVSAGQPIDIFYADPIAYPRDVGQFGLAYDMSALIKEFNFDQTRLYPGPIQVMRDTFNKGVTGLPLAMRNVVLHYNKDLFDKFGVAPPRDGMTWDEVYELARKMTRTEGGVQYRGMDFSVHVIDYNQLSLGWIDSKTERASVNNSQWNELIRNFSRFYQIPGNEVGTPAAKEIMDWNRFGVKGITAMEATTFYPATVTKDLFNMDYASLPSFTSKPGVGSQSPSTYIGITSSAKNPKEAFRVIEYLLSDEFQTMQSRKGTISALQNKAVNDVFGADVPELAGKNLKPVIPAKSAAPAPFHKWSGQTQASYWTPLLKVFTGETDLNTGLRNMEESINKKIDELNSSAK
ncbi:carbohydrate ABC transporter substrate-binding protein [Paenibacillus mesophilus]|uniref:ABC transporter substrate-binding protein n=1 Tax=Paenibacillus mesophilus TaxID=2582849 RepID=UPI00110EB235|nr:ABC transporter substrate-binding protein [Paenibacillus mesophilus]TMV45508.1 carbohydrate ABC transporter substrate-binding protein [Paenibacillus mesophilus]